MATTAKSLTTPSAHDTDATYYKDATELASLVRTKELSSREVVQAHLDRIQAINPKINAIVTLLAEDALKEFEVQAGLRTPEVTKPVETEKELGPAKQMVEQK